MAGWAEVPKLTKVLRVKLSEKVPVPVPVTLWKEKPTNPDDFLEAVHKLDTLAQEEYRSPLAQVVGRQDHDRETRLLRVGRLIGVMLKQPFATTQLLDTASPFSQAYRSWELNPETAFEDPEARNTWQYHTLEELRRDPDVVQSRGFQHPSAYAIAQDAQFERGFFGYLAISCRRYLCGNSQLRAEIERQLESAERAGIEVKALGPHTLVSAGAVSIATLLVQSIPILGIVSTPVVAGLIVIVFNIGLDAFCQWASNPNLFNATKET